MLDRLFPSSCPCDTAAKAWVERRLQWLSDEFDDHAFNGRRVVLPTPEFFPDPYDGSQLSVRKLLDRVCGYMDVDTDLITLRFQSRGGKVWLVNGAGQGIPDAAGTYEESGSQFDDDGEFIPIRPRRYGDPDPKIITLDTSGLENQMTLVGTMAHELAHVRLMGERRLRGDEFDNELLTDLTVVFFGLGIFLANAPRSWESQFTKWPGTSLIKPEYMTRPMFGYALAHLAWFQGQEFPDWAKHLHWNARAEFKQAVRFLFKKGESRFKPVKLRLRMEDLE
jgi:hypothetical protein